MTSYVTPKKNAAFVTYVSLEDQANAGLFKASPTLAAGDFKVSIDGGALTNLATLPTNTPSGSAMVKISLSAAEMNGDNITVVCKDAAGDEWYDLVLNIQTTARQVDDLSTLGGTAQTGDAYAVVAHTDYGNAKLVRSTTPANTLDIAAGGEASANVTLWAGDAVAGAPALEATAQAILEDTGTTLPAAIAAVDSDVWSYATRTLTQSSTSTTDSTAAGSIARRRGDSWSISLTVGAITGYTSLWFTAKWDRDNTDAQAVLQIKLNASGLNDGLLYVNGAAATDDTLASITVSDASTGAIVIAVDETVTDDLPPAGIYYDVQALVSGTVSTLDSGTLTISADVTRAVA